MGRIGNEGGVGSPGNAPVGGVTRTGGNTTEATTTSTTVVDLLAGSGLSIAAKATIVARVFTRKSAGAAASTGCSIKINATEVGTPTSANGTINVSGESSATDRAEECVADMLIPGIVASYTLNKPTSHITNITSAGTVENATGQLANSANQPNAVRTDIIVNAISGSALVTVGADELNIYTQQAS